MAEEAGGEVRALNGDPLLLLVQLLGGYSVTPVYSIRGCPVHLAIYKFLLRFPMLPTIGLAYPSRMEPMILMPDGCN